MSPTPTGRHNEEAHEQCLHPECIRQRAAAEQERIAAAYQGSPFSPREPDRYPGWEKDLNNGQPLDLADLTSALHEGVALQEGKHNYTTGNMGLDLGSREVFVLVRHGDGRPDESYWVTGVRLVADESGSSSLAGAIELVAEDGDRAQQRQLDKEHQATAEQLIAKMATVLAGIRAQGGTVEAQDVADLRNTAAHMLRSYADVLDIPSELAEYL